MDWDLGSGAAVPFLLRVGASAVERIPLPWRDEPALECPLATVLGHGLSGFIAVRDTRVTRVKDETTDDS
jgi:hypothetical protein